MATLYRANGTSTVVHPAGKKWTLDELQKLVGGYIELMPGMKRLRMLMNEDGKLQQLPKNYAATELVHRELSGQVLRYLPEIVGDVVVLDKGEKF